MQRASEKAATELANGVRVHPDYGRSFLIGMSADPIARELNGIVS